MQTTNHRTTKCSICGTPYVRSSNAVGQSLGILEPVCNCLEKKLEEEARASGDISAILRSSGVPARASRDTFETYEDIVGTIGGPAAKVRRWINSGGTGILLLAGNTGAGKTSMAAAALREFHEKGIRPVRYFYAYDLLTRGVNFDTREAALESALRPGALVIDEIGIQLRSEAALAFLERVMVGRHDDGKSTIIVTNEKPDDFWEIAGDRVKDRIMLAGLAVSFTGKSLRSWKQPEPVNHNEEVKHHD